LLKFQDDIAKIQGSEANQILSQLRAEMSAPGRNNITPAS
jgi:hypothetical protein